ncbi:acetyl-CoA synthetase-like protein [Sphaerulina musiva SO2202]|uniref:Acetyl-CoA synthetase-like protein n=1 Tax=Sphaerulina musiva (strain SO2202) TaxID=692275 RepID=M3CII9_SPHMS|nr:acetyl-CoA synthetase-like protein [Sphaerulina musiva SO2202]EMF13633.1 acetyl-CoA synthetase-like protein [Sphaerulina musiva SO2202]
MLWKSDHPDLDIPSNVTTWEWLFESREHSPLHHLTNNQPLGRYENAVTKGQLDYAEVKDVVTKLSTALVRKYGFETGDTISILATNTVWYPVALWAAIRAGGRVNGASPGYNVGEMTYALKTAKTKFLFTLPGSLDVAVLAAKQAGMSSDHVFLLEGERQGFTSVQQLIELGASYSPTRHYSIPAGKTNKEICGYLNFSSGTTGLPKAVMLSHHNIIAQCHQLRQLQVLDAGEQPKMLGVTPLFHITGLIRYIHYPVFMNGISLLLPTFSMESMLHTIITYRIRELILVPPILIRLVRDPIVSHHLPALQQTVRRWSSGSAPTPAEIIQLLHEKFPQTGFRQGYGATESTACISCHPPECYDYKYANTAGKLCANTTAKIIDLDDRSSKKKELGPGETGEICARGPQIAMGYLDNAAATAETFDSDGFFHTGDVGYIDHEGFLHIQDRIKEMIKVRGQQVAPAELEDALLGHAAVEDCAVLGIADDYSGEKPKAYVLVRAGVEASEGLGRELLEFVRERKSRYKWLKEVEFTRVIPKSPTGKLLRRVLKAGDGDAKRVRGIVVRDEGSTLSRTSKL